VKVPAKTPRLIQVLGKGLRFSVETKEPVVYLTFDDGPIPGLTPWILGQLNEYGAKATFFMVGENAKNNPEVLLHVLAEGHRIGNHTQNHFNGFKTKTAEYVANAEACGEVLRTYLPKDAPLLFRPPYGRITPRQVFRIRKLGYQIIMWDVLSKDYEAKLDPETVVRNVLDNVKPGSIVVMHDNIKAEKNLHAALPEILKGLKEKGFRMEALP
jgi:peptidoglycan/xylan/chitin deacetylase (PgdA/CDA1 family)